VKIQIESTDRIVKVNGIEARVWEGETESGIPVIVCVTRIAVNADQECSEFERELLERRAPSADANAFPLRMIL
jgi:hypothetical protein